MEFEAVHRSTDDVLATVRAQMKSPGWNLTLYLDSRTGSVMYPVVIEQAVPGMTCILLDSATASSCTFPPAVPDSLVDGIINGLKPFHEVVGAAREFVRKERERLGKEG